MKRSLFSFALFVGCLSGLCLASEVNPVQVVQQGAPSSVSSCEHTESVLQCVRFLYNHDGDTLTVSIPNVHPLLGQKISVRVFGVDTPEMYSDDPCERDAALVAQKFVRVMVSRGQRLDLYQVQRDKYFRILADVRIDGESLSRALISRGLAYPYYGGTKQKIDWCPARSVSVE